MKVVKFTDYEVDDIDFNDYPDFVDAHISSATAVLEDGSVRDATEDELVELNEDYDLVSELVMDRIIGMGE